MERENQAKGEQSERVKEMQERLQKTMELKEQVETMFTLELQGLSEKLASEAGNEQTRAEEIVELKAKFSSALIAKKDSLEKDETLLKQMQSTQGMLREAAIKVTMDQAITDKETLCSIERVRAARLPAYLSLCLPPPRAFPVCYLSYLCRPAGSLASAPSRWLTKTHAGSIRCWWARSRTAWLSSTRSWRRARRGRQR